jgi:hypothetical protein
MRVDGHRHDPQPAFRVEIGPGCAHRISGGSDTVDERVAGGRVGRAAEAFGADRGDANRLAALGRGRCNAAIEGQAELLVERMREQAPSAVDLAGDLVLDGISFAAVLTTQVVNQADEEEQVMAYFGGGYLYGLPGRTEPII